MELCFAVPERKRNSEQRRTLGQVTFMMFVFVTEKDKHNGKMIVLCFFVISFFVAPE